MKGNCISKKSCSILCKGNRLEAYWFTDQHHEEFVIRWLLRRLGIYPNAYYNYWKHQKADYYAQKAETKKQMDEIYHSHNSIDGYRSIKKHLKS